MKNYVSYRIWEYGNVCFFWRKRIYMILFLLDIDVELDIVEFVFFVLLVIFLLLLGFVVVLVDVFWFVFFFLLEVGCVLEFGFVVFWLLFGDGVGDVEVEVDDVEFWFDCLLLLEDVGLVLFCGWDVMFGEEVVIFEGWMVEEVMLLLVVMGLEVGVVELILEVEVLVIEDMGLVDVGIVEVEFEIFDMMGLKIYSI